MNTDASPSSVPLKAVKILLKEGEWISLKGKMFRLLYSPDPENPEKMCYRADLGENSKPLVELVPSPSDDKEIPTDEDWTSFQVEKFVAGLESLRPQLQKASDMSQFQRVLESTVEAFHELYKRMKVAYKRGPFVDLEQRSKSSKQELSPSYTENLQMTKLVDLNQPKESAVDASTMGADASTLSASPKDTQDPKLQVVLVNREGLNNLERELRETRRRAESAEQIVQSCYELFAELQSQARYRQNIEEKVIPDLLEQMRPFRGPYASEPQSLIPNFAPTISRMHARRNDPYESKRPSSQRPQSTGLFIPASPAPVFNGLYPLPAATTTATTTSSSSPSLPTSVGMPSTVPTNWHTDMPRRAPTPSAAQPTDDQRPTAFNQASLPRTSFPLTMEDSMTSINLFPSGSSSSSASSVLPLNALNVRHILGSSWMSKQDPIGGDLHFSGYVSDSLSPSSTRPWKNAPSSEISGSGNLNNRRTLNPQSHVPPSNLQQTPSSVQSQLSGPFSVYSEAYPTSLGMMIGSAALQYPEAPSQMSAGADTAPIIGNNVSAEAMPVLQAGAQQNAIPNPSLADRAELKSLIGYGSSSSTHHSQLLAPQLWAHSGTRGYGTGLATDLTFPAGMSFAVPDSPISSSAAGLGSSVPTHNTSPSANDPSSY